MTGWLRRVRARIRHRRFERDVAEELQFHRAAKEAELSSAGLGADEARWQASREMGNVTLMREEARAVWLAPWLESVWQDVRYASRQFRAHPAFTATAIITLLLAIGLNTTLFTVFNAIALRSWPVSDPDSVVLVSGAPQMTRQGRSDGISFAEHRFLRSHATSFSGLVAMRRKGARIGRGSTGEAEFVQACFVSDDFFQVLGVGMELGRGFVREEGAPGAPRAVVVISEGLWRRQFGANPTAIGRTISINEVAFTVVGVAARRFTGPHPIQRYDVFMPLPAMALGWNVEADEFDNAERCCADVIGRLAPGVGATRAAAELDALSRRFRASWKLRPARIVLDGTSVMASAAARNRLAPVFSLMFAGVFLVLLVACANIGNLQLARAFSRRREIGVRLALGASRRRVVRQLCTESLMLALVAGGFAAGVAWVLPGAIVGLSRSADEVSLTLAPDLRVLAFTLGVSLLAALAAGLAPALRGTRPGPAIAVPGGPSIGGSRVSLRAVLLGTQIAVVTVLLVAAGLLSRGVVTAASADLGFAVDDVLMAKVTWPAGSASATGWLPAALDALSASGLGPVAMADVAPLEPSRLSMRVRLPAERDSDARSVRLAPVSAGYFGVLRIPIVAGRPFDDRSRSSEVVVNETFAKLFFPGQSAVGQRVVDVQGSRPFEVVGVVRDSHVTGLDEVPPLLHRRQSLAIAPNLLLRASAPDVAGRMQEVLAAIDPRASVAVTPLAPSIRLSLKDAQFAVGIAWALGLLGLALAIVGVVGVFAYVVEDRRREIGIRLALGARRSQVVGLVLSVTRAATLGGLGIGFVLSLGVGPLLRRYLYGTSPLDPIAYGAVAVVLLVSALVASYLPARRATRVDPAVTLRCE